MTETDQTTYVYSTAQCAPGGQINTQTNLMCTATGQPTQATLSTTCGVQGGGGGAPPCTQDGGSCWYQSDCCNWDCTFGVCGGYTDPIIIDTTGNGYQMTSAAEGVQFAINSGTAPVKLSWTAADSGDAWLALDLNGNGRIDNMTELFSNFMPMPGSGRLAANGFEVLAAYDLPENGGNGDGMISDKDAVYKRLLLWIDKNHNGISEPDELFTMSQLGIASIDLKYSTVGFVDPNGNAFRYRSLMTGLPSAHVGQFAYDVLLQRVGSSAPPFRPASQEVAPERLLAGNPPARGRADAPVTVAVFSDFQCPFCASAARTIDGLQEAYGDDIRVVYRYYPLPFHKWAQPAAQRAACANDQSVDAFWKLHNFYFTHQSELSAETLSQQSLDVVANIPGFDTVAFRRCVASSANSIVAKDLELGQAAGVGGTPTIFVNGERVQGVQGMIDAVGRLETRRSSVLAVQQQLVPSGAECKPPALASASPKQ